MDYEKKIEIPFGAHDSELKGWEYTIPEGFTADIKDGKVIVREKESEDERIRKWLVDYFKSVGKSWIHLDISPEQILSYLEKQKELPFVKDVMLGYPGIYFYDGERMHFQGNPAMEENLKKQDADFSINDTSKNDARKRRQIIALLSASKGKCLASFAKDIDECIAYLIEKQRKPHFTKRNALFDKCVENCDPKVMKRVSDKIDAMLEKEKEQKPVEWSEEDERMRNALWNLLHLHYAQDNAQTLVGIEAGKFRSWLKSLSPQPKEDIDAIAKREYERGKRDGYWEGYKKAEENYNNFVAFHYDYPTSPSIKRSCYEGRPCTNPQMDCINCPWKTKGGMFNTASSSGDLTLKAEWKPSEEQMEALYEAAQDAPVDREDGNALYSLYEQLKKLM